MDRLIYSTLKKYWGFESFRPPQEEIVENILFGHDCLITLSTGGGKSLCYQLPAVLSQGLTIVISPLIALMQDQVDSLNRRGIPSCFLNSSLLPEQYREILKKLAVNHYKLLYLAPEQFRSVRLTEIIKRIKVARVILDEAHCLSEWGNDFRPDYRTFVKQLNKISPGVQLVALTATATIRTRKEIIKVLGMKTPFISVSSFDRTNLFIGVKKFFTPFGKYLELKKLLKNSRKALIYCSTREETSRLCNSFSVHYPGSAFYNAGLSQPERKSIQEAYQTGQCNKLFATTAFGMGIDISDIDTVIYWNCPASPEEYYQGIGRAGRNPSLQAVSWLLYYRPDFIIQQTRNKNENISVSEIKKLAETLDSEKQFLRNTTGLSDTDFNSLKILLEENGSEDLKLIRTKYQEIINSKKEKLAAIKKIISSRQCKRQLVLEYFGEEVKAGGCNNCSYCITRS